MLEFAKHLRAKGVDVTLDQWSLGMGDNRFQFMEKSVTRSEFVLVICTPTYAENDMKSGLAELDTNPTSLPAELRKEASKSSSPFFGQVTGQSRFPLGSSSRLDAI